MKLTLKRTYKGDAYTIGHLYVDGIYQCDTLEDTDRGLKASRGEGWNLARKIKGQTAIPVGTYKVTLKLQSPRFSALKYRNQYGWCDAYLP